MALVNQKQKEKYNKLVKRYVNTKNVLIFGILLFVFLTFSSAFKGILLVAFFLPLARYSVKVTAFVPHVTLEQYTSSTIFLAYIYGPAIGALSGLVLGLYGYLSNGISKFLALVNVFVASLVGFMIGTFVKTGFMKTWSFSSSFVLGIAIFNLIAFIVFYFVDPDKIQNLTYRSSHLFFNGLISVIFFNLFYMLFNMIG